MAKRKAETGAAAGTPKRPKPSTQPNVPSGRKIKVEPGNDQPTQNGADKSNKAFHNWLKQMKKHHRKQVNKAQNGQEVDLKWNDKRRDLIGQLRARGMLKAKEEGEFSWPADIPPSKYDGSTNITKSSSDNEDETEDEVIEKTALVAKTGNGGQITLSPTFDGGHKGTHDLATQAVQQDKGTETIAENQDRTLWSGNVVIRLADVTGGEHTRPELVLKLNIEVCQKGQEAN